MAAIKNIIFDLGGVLLNLDMEKTRQAFLDLGFRDYDQRFRPGFADAFFRSYEIGTIGNREFLETLKQYLHPRSTEGDIVNAWNAMLLDFPKERVDWLSGLASRYRLFLFSNTNAIHLEAFSNIFREAFPGHNLDDLFEKTYYSHLAGVRKPEAAAYLQVLSENNLAGEETLFIDDTGINVEAARSLGLHGIHLTGNLTLTDLKL